MGVYSSRRSNRTAAASSARNPSGITSWPMPSPGITAILNDVAIWILSGQGGAHVALLEHVVQRTPQPLEQQIHFPRAVAQGRSKPQDVVAERPKNNAVAIGDLSDTFAQAQRGIETTLGRLVGDEFQSAQETTLARIAHQRMLQQLLQPLLEARCSSNPVREQSAFMIQAQHFQSDRGADRM